MMHYNCSVIALRCNRAATPFLYHSSVRREGEFANLAEHLKVLASQMEGEVKMLGKHKGFRPALIWTVRAEYSVARIENWTSHAR
jgi:hypothetical protein